jgi:hypothetical protein
VEHVWNMWSQVNSGCWDVVTRCDMCWGN